MSEKVFSTLRELIDEIYSVSNYADACHQNLVKLLSAHSAGAEKCTKGCMDLFPHPKVVSSAKTTLDSFAQELVLRVAALPEPSEDLETFYFIRAYNLINKAQDLFDRLQRAHQLYMLIGRPYNCRLLDSR